MCRFVKRFLCVAATLLAFYGGYAWQGETRADLCASGSDCNTHSCAGSSDNKGCKFTQGPFGKICVLQLPPQGTCGVPDTNNFISCSGTNSGGGYCTGILYICTGPCPPP